MTPHAKFITMFALITGRLPIKPFYSALEIKFEPRHAFFTDNEAPYTPGFDSYIQRFSEDKERAQQEYLGILKTIAYHLKQAHPNVASQINPETAHYLLSYFVRYPYYMLTRQMLTVLSHIPFYNGALTTASVDECFKNRIFKQPSELIKPALCQLRYPLVGGAYQLVLAAMDHYWESLPGIYRYDQYIPDIFHLLEQDIAREDISEQLNKITNQANRGLSSWLFKLKNILVRVQTNIPEREYPDFVRFLLYHDDVTTEDIDFRFNQYLIGDSEMSQRLAQEILELRRFG